MARQETLFHPAEKTLDSKGGTTETFCNRLFASLDALKFHSNEYFMKNNPPPVVQDLGYVSRTWGLFSIQESLLAIDQWKAKS